jgi:PAS domain S-box-containing protein
MRIIQRLITIKNRLLFIILFVTLTTGIIGFSIAIYFQAKSSKNEIVNNLNLEAGLIGQYCIASLKSDDKQRATEVLNKLKSFPSILKGEIYDKNIKLFSSYNIQHKNIESFKVSKTPLSEIKGKYIHIIRPIEYQNVNYGYIYIIASKAEYRKDNRNYIMTLIPFIAILLTLSILLSNYLLKFISIPILELTKFTERVSQTKDYALRIKTKSDDEIGVLYNAFNNMLEQISFREAERDLAEHALRASENKNRTLIEAIPDLIYIFDKSGRFLYCKAKSFEVLPVNHEHIIGKNIKDLIFSPHQLKMMNHFVDKAFKTKKVQSYEYEIKGQGYYEERLIALNENEILCIVRDITEQKDIAKQLEHEKIRAGAAEEADKLKSAFLANMSHEIRTPMNAIIGFSNLLRDDDITEDEKNEYIELINHSGDNLLSLIDDIIDISKIEAGQLVINTKECNVNKTLDEMLVFFEKDKLTKKKEHLSIDLNIPESAKELKIVTDCNRFKQIITNLISNALKFTEEGGIEFGYKIDNSPDTKDHSESTKTYLEFYVKDTGIGIPENSLEEIFDRFKKLENKRVKLYGGAGLGLAICKNLVENLGGKIWAESIEGKGATFFFTLPLELKQVMSEKSDVGTPTLEIIPQPTYDWSNKTVLVVDDEEFVCKYFERILTPTKAKILLAKSGIEAYESCKKNNDIDIVLMDMKLPDLSGYEAVKKIKKMNVKFHIIAQTAYAMAEDKIECLKVGCDDYIAKPIEAEILLEKMQSVFSMSK